MVQSNKMLILMTLICLTACQSLRSQPTAIDCPIRPVWVSGEFGKWSVDEQRCVEPGSNGGCWSTAHKRYISTVIDVGIAAGCWTEETVFTNE